MDLLGAVRLSRHRGEADPSTSPDRQHGVVAELAGTRKDNIVGWAVDLDVSAITLTPFERPELGTWLAERLREFDGIAWARLDRAVRSMHDLHTLAAWATKHKKVLLFANGPGGAVLELDMRAGPLAPIPMLIVTILAFAAQMEAQAITERNRDTRAYMRQMGRWPGGMFPYHTMPKKTGNEWRLVLNPETSPITLEIIDRVIRRQSKLSIATALNMRGVPSPREYRLLTYTPEKIPTAPVAGRVEVGEERAPVVIHPADGGEPVTVKIFPKQADLAVVNGEEVEAGQRLTLPIQWNSGTIGNFLRARVLIGHSELDGKPVLGPDGMPVQRVEPLIQREEWDLLQLRLDEQSKPSGKNRTAGASMLLDIGFCASCGAKLHYRAMNFLDPKYAYYGCRSSWGGITRQKKEDRCTAKSIRSFLLNDLVETILLAEIGSLEIFRPVFVPGHSNAGELRDASEALGELLLERAGKSGKVREIYDQQIAGLEKRIEALAAMPETDDHTVLQGTGMTYAEYWTDASVEGRRTLLQETGIKIFVGQGAVLPGLKAAIATATGPHVHGVSATVGKDFRVQLLWPDELAKQLAGSRSA